MKTLEVGIGIKRSGSALLPPGSFNRQQDEKISKRFCTDFSPQNRDGQTQLHLLCQDRTTPIDSIRDAILEHPSSLGHKDVYGRTPLFYALKRGCSVKMIKLLFDHFPEAILMKDFCGDMPLYLVYHSSIDFQILKHVLKENPALAIHTENSFSGQSLVKRLCTPWASNQCSFTQENLEDNAILKDRWNKMVLTLQAAHSHKMGMKTMDFSRPELHIALEFGCPPTIVTHFVRIYPEQASLIMEGRGCYPLHYFLSESDLEQCDDITIGILIGAYPPAVKIRYRGELAIHTGVRRCLSWKAGLQQIVFAAPVNLDCPHPRSNLIPVLHRATLDEFDVTSVYSLLREHPVSLQNMVTQ